MTLALLFIFILQVFLNYIFRERKIE